MLIDSEGWLRSARRVDSPNRGPRDTEIAPTLVVLHAISLPPREFGGDHVEALFKGTLNPDAHPYFAGIAHLRVSAHFFVRRDGEIVQTVSCNEVAWHAGASTWRGQEKCNAFSIGIELEGCDELPFTAVQYAALSPLLQSLRDRYLSLHDAAAHSDIAPGRKTDPGPYFDWAQIAPHWQRWRNEMG